MDAGLSGGAEKQATAFLEPAIHRFDAFLGQGDEYPAAILRVGLTHQQTALGQLSDPAQRRGRRNGGGDAQARHRYLRIFKMSRHQIEQDVSANRSPDNIWSRSLRARNTALTCCALSLDPPPILAGGKLL